MTNSSELRRIIKEEKGMSYSFVAKKLGISSTGLQKKIDNLVEFKPSEIVILCKLLGLTTMKQRDDIFFAHKVENNSTVERE